MVLYWGWIMSNLSKTYHGQSSVLLFQTSLTTILPISQDFLHHHVSYLQKQRDKLNVKTSKILAFLSQQFHYNKKPSW